MEEKEEGERRREKEYSEAIEGGGAAT